MNFVLNVKVEKQPFSTSFSPKTLKGGFNLIDKVKSKYPLAETTNIHIGVNTTHSPAVSIDELTARLSGRFLDSSEVTFFVNPDQIQEFTEQFSKIVAEPHGDGVKILVTVGFDSKAFILEWAKTGYPENYGDMVTQQQQLSTPPEPKKRLTRDANGRFIRE